MNASPKLTCRAVGRSFPEWHFGTPGLTLAKKPNFRLCHGSGPTETHARTTATLLAPARRIGGEAPLSLRQGIANPFYAPGLDSRSTLF